MVANSTFLWPYNWPLDWPFWCNLLTEGVVSYEELGNAKKPYPKSVQVLSILKMLLSANPCKKTQVFCCFHSRSLFPRGR